MITRKTLFSLLAGSISLSALAGSAMAQTVTYDPSFVQQLPTARLTTAGMQVLACGASSIMFIPGSSLGYTYTGTQVCNLLSNDPLFYSTTTPRFYRVNLCNPNPGQVDYFVTGNLLVLTGNRAGLTPNNLTYPDNTPTQATYSLCNAPSATFNPPPGFVAQTTDSPVIAFGSTDLQGNTVPSDPSNPSYSTNGIGMSFGIFRFSSSIMSPLAVPYTVTGTAANGTDYRLVDVGAPNPNAPALPNSGNLIIQAGSTVGGAAAFVVYDPNNHPEKTVTVTFSTPAGYQLIGSNTMTGRIVALNNPAVSITTINGQTALTPGSVNQGFTLTRTGGDQTIPLSVSYQVSGTASNGTDYGYLSGTATIPANQSSLNIPISVPQSGGAVGAKTIGITLNPDVANYNFGATTTPPTQAFNIPAYNPSTVTVTPGSNTTLVPGSTQQVGIVTRSGGDTTQPLTVTLTPGGTAQQPQDYTLPGTVTIPAGQLTAPILLTTAPQGGAASQPAKTVDITPATGTGYNVAQGTAPITATIPAYNPNAVTVSVNGSSNLTPGTSQPAITVTRSGGSTTQALTIPLSVGGTAVPGTDYNPLPTSITIPAGATTASLSVAALPQSGTTAKPASTITVAAAPPGASDTYIVSGTGATLNIPAYTPPAGAPAITVSAPNGTTLAAGSSVPALQFTRTGATTSSLPVYYTIAGNAIAGSDYSGLSGQTTIPAGQSSVTVPVTVPAGATVGRTINVALAIPGSMYGSGTNTQATYTIGAATNSVSPTTVTVAFDPSVPALIVTRTGGNTTQPLSVPLSIGGSAIPGVDYASIPSSADFAGGQTRLTIPLQLLSGATNGRTVTVATTGGTASYTISGVGTTTTTTTTPTAKKDGGSGGSALAPIAGVAGLGGLAAATGLFSSGGIAAATSGFAAVPDYCAAANGNIDWQIGTGTNGGIPFSKPDITFAKLGLAHTQGQARVKGQTVAWGGQSNPATPADALNLGNLDGVYNLQCLNLAQIERASGKRLADKPLGETGLMRQTTLANLARTAYQKAKTVGDIPGMAEKLANNLPLGNKLSKDAIAKMSFAELFQQVPQLQQLNLGSTVIGQIPGFMQVPIANFGDWKNFAVSEVPGLADVPYGQFPSRPEQKTSQR